MTTFKQYKFTTIIIDPPVSIYSTEAKINEWLARLSRMKESPERDHAIDQAKSWLKVRSA